MGVTVKWSGFKLYTNSTLRAGSLPRFCTVTELVSTLNVPAAPGWGTWKKELCGYQKTTWLLGPTYFKAQPPKRPRTPPIAVPTSASATAPSYEACTNRQLHPSPAAVPPLAAARTA